MFAGTAPSRQRKWKGWAEGKGHKSGAGVTSATSQGISRRTTGRGQRASWTTKLGRGVQGGFTQCIAEAPRAMRTSQSVSRPGQAQRAQSEMAPPSCGAYCRPSAAPRGAGVAIGHISTEGPTTASPQSSGRIGQSGLRSRPGGRFGATRFARLATAPQVAPAWRRTPRAARLQLPFLSSRFAPLALVAASVVRVAGCPEPRFPFLCFCHAFLAFGLPSDGPTLGPGLAFRPPPSIASARRCPRAHISSA